MQKQPWLDPIWWLWQPARLWYEIRDGKRRRRLKQMSSQEIRAYWDWWPEYRDRIDATHSVVQHLDAVLGGRATAIELDNEALLDGLAEAEIRAGRKPHGRPWHMEYSVEFPFVMDALRRRLRAENESRAKH